jgi:hypothetical protein
MLVVSAAGELMLRAPIAEENPIIPSIRPGVLQIVAKTSAMNPKVPRKIACLGVNTGTR